MPSCFDLRAVIRSLIIDLLGARTDRLAGVVWVGHIAFMDWLLAWVALMLAGTAAYFVQYALYSAESSPVEEPK